MKSIHVTAVAILALLGAGIGFVAGTYSSRSTGPDAVLAESFQQALAHSDKVWTQPTGNLWLSSLTTPIDGKKADSALSVGDLITVAGKDGQARAVQVTSLEQIDGAPLGLPSVHFQLVTARPVHAHSGAPMRFLFAVDKALPAAALANPLKGREL
ncbi:MAG: hypothetical protein ACK5JT_13360 [Hyphomicrobiaceae bacterium]